MSNSQKGFTPIIIILGIALLLGIAGGAYFLGKNSNTAVKNNPVITPTLTSTPTATLKADETANPDSIGANWKTYTNEKSNYKVSYPSDWTIKENNNSAYDLVSFSSLDANKTDPTGDIAIVVEKTNLLVKANSDANSAFQTLMGACSTETPTQCTKKMRDTYKFEKQTTVAGLTAFQTYGGCCMDIGRHVFVFNNDNKYTFTLYNLGANSSKLKNEDVFNQILSTFKFTDTKVGNGKYTCPENGYQNCMPILDAEGQKQCSKEALDWKAANCPNFSGAAY